MPRGVSKKVWQSVEQPWKLAVTTTIQSQDHVEHAGWRRMHGGPERASMAELDEGVYDIEPDDFGGYASERVGEVDDI